MMFIKIDGKEIIISENVLDDRRKITDILGIKNNDPKDETQIRIKIDEDTNNDSYDTES